MEYMKTLFRKIKRFFNFQKNFSVKKINKINNFLFYLMKQKMIKLDLKDILF
jgi:hypothetical protein